MSASSTDRTDRFSQAAAGSAPDEAREHHCGTPRDLGRLAELVAHGLVPLPGDLTAGELTTVVERVRQLRKRRLVRFIAGAIALDIHRSTRCVDEEKDHASETV